MDRDLEKKLVMSCRNGDKSAYAGLVKGHSGRVFAICLGMLGNTHDAEDIAQQTFLKGLANIRQVRSDELFGAWISRIAKNLCIDLVRERKRARSSLAGAVVPDQRGPRQFAELKSALAKLSERHRLTLMLYYFDGRSTRGLAEALAVSEGAAQACLSRARKKLRRLLEAQGGI